MDRDQDHPARLTFRSTRTLPLRGTVLDNRFKFSSPSIRLASFVRPTNPMEITLVKHFFAFLLCVSFAFSGETEHYPLGTRLDLSKLGFFDQNKKKCTVADFKGKIVVVDFWTIWCGPCRRSLPELHAIQKQGIDKGSLVVIPCNLDDDYWPQGVLQFMKKNEKALDGFVYYRAQIGGNGIATNLGKDIQSYPTTLVIDREGKLATRWSGYGEGLLVFEINKVLKEKP